MLEFSDLGDNIQNKDDEFSKIQLEHIISDLQLYSNDKKKLTETYTEILMNDNVVYILTRISQNEVFRTHFPELYEKNKYGESVINCQQNTIYHRYGVFKHTLWAIENVGKDSLKFNEHELKILKWTMLLHDIGKPRAKVINGTGSDSFAGHEDISVDMASAILDRFDFAYEEKDIILKLIKYHDKYLNAGDLTYDNLSYLAHELDDRKDLFYLLMEVKQADNKAKSLDVYNKFVSTQKKYYEFIGEYFNNLLDLDALDDVNRQQEDKNDYGKTGETQEIEEQAIDDLCYDISVGKRIDYYYEPIIDITNKIIEGYEVSCRIITDNFFPYKQIIRKAKECDKYDQLQQNLFIKTVEKLDKLSSKKKLTYYINLDVNGYKTYDKTYKVIDTILKQNVTLDFNNFEMLNNNDLKEIAEEFKKVNVKICIDNFDTSTKNINDIDYIFPNVVKYKLETMDNNDLREIQELQTFCDMKSITFIVTGIDMKEQLDFASSMGIRYVQGKYFSKDKKSMRVTNKHVEKLINQMQDDKIL